MDALGFKQAAFIAVFGAYSIIPENAHEKYHYISCQHIFISLPILKRLLLIFFMFFLTVSGWLPR